MPYHVTLTMLMKTLLCVFFLSFSFYQLLSCVFYGDFHSIPHNRNEISIRVFICFLLHFAPLSMKFRNCDWNLEFQSFLWHTRVMLFTQFAKEIYFKYNFNGVFKLTNWTINSASIKNRICLRLPASFRHHF